ncbi:MAG: VanZ family protein [Sarcina sp.]
MFAINNYLYYLSILVFLVYIITNIVLVMKGKKLNKSREFVKFMFLVYFFGVLSYTMRVMFYSSEFKERINLGAINYIPLVETIKMFQGSKGTALYQVIGNLIMFVPLGMFVAVLYKKSNSILKVAGISLICTLIIEVSQFFGGRGIDIDDVIINTLGGILGYLIYKVLEKPVKKIKIFRTILNDSSSNKLALKGILVVAIPVILVLHGMNRFADYMIIKNDSVDIATVASMIEEEGNKVISKEEEEWGVTYLYTDKKGGYYQRRYNEDSGNYFPSTTVKINDNPEYTTYLYDDGKSFLVSDGWSNNIDETIDNAWMYIKAPIGSNVILYKGDKEVKVKIEEELAYEDIDLQVLKVKNLGEIEVRIEK